MNSSLLPNDIQDIDGLELKEQVKVLKDYIEYMREQLQWFSSVTDKNEEGFVQSVTTYYGVSTSQTTPPSQWSTEAPVVSDGEYLWQYTKTTRSGVTTRSEPVCISSSFTAGEDAALVYIHSSNGNVFHAGNTGTVLTVTVYYGSDAIRTLSNLQTAFGSGAHLAWYVKEYGESTYDPVSPSDPRLSDNGFTFTLDADDVDTKASYNCRLMLSSTVTRSQSSITITDVDDGYTSVLSQESVTWNGNDTNLGSNKTVSFSVSGYCGPDTAPFTIGTPVLSDTTNASASVSGSTVTLSVSSAATTGGTVTLPVIFTDGPTLHNTFSYFVVLKGAQGIQGDQGEQGIQGPAGEDGQTTYIHIKYSHTANPQTSADISDEPDDYIGICTNTTQTDPTDPAAYAPWTRFVGEDGPQGIPGETGEDGTTYYVHFAYGTSDQGADFSVTPFEGATYIGVCTDENELDPVTPASYTWSLTKGEKGDAGYNAATIFLYQRKSSVPNKQAGTLTYTFATKALTGTLDNGWSTSIPSGTNPLYVIIATASSNTATDSIVSADWSSPVVLAQDGGTGAGISSVTEVYFAKANTTAPAAPSSTVTTNDPTVYNAWNKALPTYSASYPYYFTCSEVLLSNGTRVWSTPVYAGALTTANQTAAEASSTATTASQTATTANNTANAASQTATTAKNTADTAKSTADTAKTTADTANTNATTALNKHGYCTCSTAAGTAAKTATLSNFELKTGSVVNVLFTNANSVANATLNINSTGAKTIKWNNEALSASPSPWAAGECVTFVYDGTYWIIAGQSNIAAANIVSGSIAADRIKANVISAVNNGTGTINADKINAAGLTIAQSQVTGLSSALDGKETAVADATATYDTDQTPYMLRQSTKAIMGQESLDYIVGGTVAWNQIVPKTASTGTSNGVTFTNNGDGSWTLTGTASSNNCFLNLNYVNSTTNCFKPNHVYYCTPAKSGSATSNIGMRLYGVRNNGTAAYVYDNPKIVKAASSLDNAGWARLQVEVTSGTNIGTVKLWPQITDLTLTFGPTIAEYVYTLETASTGSGIAWLKARGFFLHSAPAYDAGSLKHVSGLSSHDTTGKNLYSQGNEQGVIYGSGTEVSTETTRCKTKGYIPVIEGSQYTIKTFTSGIYVIGYAFYDSQKRFRVLTSPSSNTRYDNTFTVPSEACYVRFDFWKQNTAFTPSEIGNVQLELGDTATAYEPYVNRTYPLDSTKTFRGVPKLVSNKLQFDGDIYYPDGTIRRRYGTVDLGTLTYSYNETYGMNAALPSDAADPIISGREGVCGRYTLYQGTAPNFAASDKVFTFCNSNMSSQKKIFIKDSAYTDSAAFKTAMSSVYLVYPLATESTESSVAYQQVQMADPAGTEGFTTTSIVPAGHYTTYPTNLKAALDTLPVDTTDAAKTATNYITNINSGGITVTGNSASSKIEIADTVKVIRDSTHFTEMTASDFNVYSGNATYPVAKLTQNGASLSGDGAGTYLARILKAGFIDAQTTYGGMFELNNTSGGVGVRIYAGPSYGTQIFYNSANKMLLRVGADTTGQGEVSVFRPTETTNNIAAKLGTITITNSYETLVDQEPTLALYDNGVVRSWYSVKRAFISDGTYSGYVVYGNTPEHGIRVAYLQSGRINFYVDTSSIGYATITSSDERMKTDIEPIDDKYKRAVGNVELKNFRFDFNDPTRAGANLLKRFGAIAQDVIKALDEEGINYEENELVETLEDDNGEYYTINYVPFLIARLAADEDRINELTTRLEALERR